MLEAERALLYTLGFDFNIDILHTHLARLLKRPRFKAMGLFGASKAAQDFQQYAISLANDIYTKDGTLVLEVRRSVGLARMGVGSWGACTLGCSLQARVWSRQRPWLMGLQTHRVQAARVLALCPCSSKASCFPKAPHRTTAD